jgi:hypothetical protein
VSTSNSTVTNGIGNKYASLNVIPSLILLCSADKNTIEQQQQEPANIIHINVHELVVIYEKGKPQ